MKQKRAYKYRFSPTDEQAHILARTFGCCRFVYNWALRQRTDAFFQHGERLYYNQLAVMLTDLKKQEEYAWLSEVSSVPLQQALRHLDSAFRNFLEGRAEYPTFKKKHGVQSATYASNAFTWDGANPHACQDGYTPGYPLEPPLAQRMPTHNHHHFQRLCPSLLCFNPGRRRDQASASHQ